MILFTGEGEGVHGRGMRCRARGVHGRRGVRG